MRKTLSVPRRSDSRAQRQDRHHRTPVRAQRTPRESARAVVVVGSWRRRKRSEAHEPRSWAKARIPPPPASSRTRCGWSSQPSRRPQVSRCTRKTRKAQRCTLIPWTGGGYGAQTSRTWPTSPAVCCDPRDSGRVRASLFLRWRHRHEESQKLAHSTVELLVLLRHSWKIVEEWEESNRAAAAKRG
ncbi:unnamed protein product [Ectocarpus sp. 4 AP-2014]